MLRANRSFLVYDRTFPAAPRIYAMPSAGISVFVRLFPRAITGLHPTAVFCSANSSSVTCYARNRCISSRRSNDQGKPFRRSSHQGRKYLLEFTPDFRASHDLISPIDPQQKHIRTLQFPTQNPRYLTISAQQFPTQAQTLR